MELLLIQAPQGYIWLSHNVPINLFSCFSAVIDSHDTHADLGAQFNSSPENCDKPGAAMTLHSPPLVKLKAARRDEEQCSNHAVFLPLFCLLALHGMA